MGHSHVYSIRRNKNCAVTCALIPLSIAWLLAMMFNSKALIVIACISIKIVVIATIIDGSGNEQIEPTEKCMFPNNSMDMTEAEGRCFLACVSDEVIIINIWLSIIARLHYLHIV